MPPSLFVTKDEFGNDTTRTFYRVRARLHDGHIVWQSVFKDREDFDAFLWAIATGSLRYERELWRLPTPHWSPDVGEELTFDFATVTFLTTTGSNQTYTSPADWANSNNSIECIGGAGSGGAGSLHSTGGGAGAYSKITNFSFATPGTTTATYRVGSGGTALTVSGVNNSDGNAGSATWFNNATDPGNGTDNTKCSAAAGAGGVSRSGSRSGGAGGATTASWGQTKYAGGRGGNLTGSFGSGGSGGGGAAGPSGAGGAGGDSASTTLVATAGGSANNGTTAGGSSTGGSGSSGTEFDPSYGCGSGGGGRATTGDATAGSGGTYGGAGGGAAGGGGNPDDATSGAGRQGLVVVTYEPAIAFSGNLAMMGM